MNNKNQAIYIIDALRSPIGKLNGMLSHIRPDDLAANLINAAISRNNLDRQNIDGVFLGCANQAGEDNRNIARMAALLANLPYSCNTITVNSLCTSGLDAILTGIRSIALEEGDLYIVGGVESMSRSPWVNSRVDGTTVDSTIGWRFVNPNIYKNCPPLSMSETAELLAKKYKIDRSTQDFYAYQSRLKYEEALQKRLWANEIIPLNNSKNQLCNFDEQHRVLSLDLLAKMPNLVQNGSCISSGNSARIGDGAALVVLASEKYVSTHKIKPLARVQSWANASCDPSYMSLSAVEAAKKIFKKTQIKPSDLDWIEMSEAFAVQALACIQDLNLDPQKVNPNGGALSIGNPISVGSARLVVSLAHSLSQHPSTKLGLATSCAGLGTGAAILLSIEN